MVIVGLTTNAFVSATQVKGTEINELLISVTGILTDIDSDQRRDIDQKVEALHGHWTQLKVLIEGRVDLVTVFVQFLQLADSLSNMFDYIEQMLRECPERERLAQLDAVWTKVKPAYEQLKSEGQRFVDEAAKVGGGLCNAIARTYFVLCAVAKCRLLSISARQTLSGENKPGGGGIVWFPTL